MSDSDEVKNILSNRVKWTNDSLTKISKLADLVPTLQHFKDNAEMSLNIFNEIPEEEAEEIAPRFLAREKEFEIILNQNKPEIPGISTAFVKVVESSSGSATPYIVDASNLAMIYTIPAKPQPDWATRVTEIIDENSLKVQQRDYLPFRLDKINRNLGEMYKVAVASYVKCKNRIIKVDQSAMHLRDVLQQVWGGLVELARSENRNENINMQNYAFKKEGDRENVASILANEVFSKYRLVDLLNNLYSLYSNLSTTDFGKNPLNEDFEKLKNYYNQWLSLLDGISGIVI